MTVKTNKGVRHRKRWGATPHLVPRAHVPGLDLESQAGTRCSKVTTPSRVHAWLGFGSCPLQGEEGNPMRVILRRLLLIVMLLVWCCIFLYFTGNGKIISDTVADLASFLHPSSCQESSYYATLACQDALEAGIPPDLFVRQIRLESNFNPNDRSPAGALGIAQFEPGTAAGLGIDPWDPVASLRGAAQLMSRYYQTYGDYAKALAAYNGGTGTLETAMRNCGQGWLSCEPAETRAYIKTIIGG